MVQHGESSSNTTWWVYVHEYWRGKEDDRRAAPWDRAGQPASTAKAHGKARDLRGETKDGCMR